MRDTYEMEVDGVVQTQKHVIDSSELVEDGVVQTQRRSERYVRDSRLRCGTDTYT